MQPPKATSPDLLPLAPGHARATLRAAPIRALTADLRRRPPRAAWLHLPPFTRAALAAPVVLPPDDASDAPTPPFLALTDRLDPPDAVLLASRGCVGAIVPASTPLPSHTLTLAAATGLPLAAALDPAALRPLIGLPLDLHVTPHAATLTPDAQLLNIISIIPPLPLHTLPVLPLVMLPEPSLRAAPCWIELITAQPDERALAAATLGLHPNPAGVGLLRLEYLAWARPDLHPDDLHDTLAALADALRPWTLAVRLPDPSRPHPLPDLATLLPLLTAALAHHPDLWLIQPHAHDPHALNALRRRLPAHLPLGAMIEAPEALPHLPALLAIADRLWLGARDLTTPAPPPGLAHALADALQRTAPQHPALVCTPWRWPGG